jgi:hypothetical protein
MMIITLHDHGHGHNSTYTNDECLVDVLDGFAVLESMALPQRLNRWHSQQRASFRQKLALIIGAPQNCEWNEIENVVEHQNDLASASLWTRATNWQQIFKWRKQQVVKDVKTARSLPCRGI